MQRLFGANTASDAIVKEPMPAPRAPEETKKVKEPPQGKDREILVIKLKPEAPLSKRCYITRGVCRQPPQGAEQRLQDRDVLSLKDVEDARLPEDLHPHQASKRLHGAGDLRPGRADIARSFVPQLCTSRGRIGRYQTPRRTNMCCSPPRPEESSRSQMRPCKSSAWSPARWCSSSGSRRVRIERSRIAVGMDPERPNIHPEIMLKHVSSEVLNGI